MNAEKLILGTVQFGLSYGINNRSGKPGKNTVFEILGSAYDFGIKTLDTAEVYGNAHALIGQFHSLNPNKVFDIISKLPHHFIGNLSDRINKYLAELKVQNLKALLFHSYDSYNTCESTVKDIKREVGNRVEHIGVSIYTNEEFKSVIDDDYIDIIQLPFNLFDNFSLRGDLIAQAKLRNKIIHTRSAFLQGMFFIDPPNQLTAPLWDKFEVIREISDELHITIGTLALNYCLQQVSVDNVLIGVDTVQHLKQNIESTKTKIPQKFISMIDSIIIENPNLINPTKWT
jgi:aryl-alcohol dehydrogenase-like predicted oxidoreductase